MFDTERNQPMRVCAGTGTDSTRKLAMSNGMFTADMPSSNGCWPCALATKVEPMVGAARSEEHTSELQSLMRISYAVFCLKKKTTRQHEHSAYCAERHITLSQRNEKAC